MKLALLLSDFPYDFDLAQWEQADWLPPPSLEEAASLSATKAFFELVEQGAVGDPTDLLFTALRNYQNEPDPVLITRLIDHGADIHAVDERGDTPLLVAAICKGYLCTLPALVEAGADVNALDNDGTSVLEHCAARGKEGCVEYLLQQRAADGG